MKKQIPKKDEDPQMYPPDPCADTAQAQKTHPKNAVWGWVDLPNRYPQEHTT